MPGIDAFSLVTSGQSFVPSAATEKLVSDQQQLLVETYGAKGQEILDEAQAEADGINAYWAANHIAQPPATVDDVIAVTAFIGSIFGAGGGGEARNSELLDELQHQLGPAEGAQGVERRHALERSGGADHHPRSASTTPRSPAAPSRARSPSTPARSSHSIPACPAATPRWRATPARPAPVNAAATSAPTITSPAGNMIGTRPNPDGTYDAASAPPDRQASNFLVVNPSRSATGDSLAVMGPQLGYYYPEIVEQMDLSAPGVQAQGAVVPGMSMYVLIGRTQNYAWSLTSADHDVRDVFAEQLCNPDHSTPTRASNHYMHNGRLHADGDLRRRLAQRHRADLPDDGARPGDRHGDRRRQAVTPWPASARRSAATGSTSAALKDMTDGTATTPQNFFHAANEFGFTFNWAYVSRRHDGLLLLRPPAGAGPEPRPPPADARHRPVRLAGLPHRGASTPTTSRAPAVCCSTGTTSPRPGSCTATTTPTARSTASSSSRRSRGRSS